MAAAAKGVVRVDIVSDTVWYVQTVVTVSKRCFERCVDTPLCFVSSLPVR